MCMWACMCDTTSCPLNSHSNYRLQRKHGYHHYATSYFGHLSGGCGSTCQSGHGIAMSQVEKEDLCSRPSGQDPKPRCISPTIAHHFTVVHTACSPAGVCSKGQFSFKMRHSCYISALDHSLHSQSHTLYS